MKNLIAAATIVLASVVSAPAIAGEAYVRNTDSYSRGSSVTKVQFAGKEIYNGVERDYSYAKKVRFDGNSIAVTGGGSNSYTKRAGYEAFSGVQLGYETTAEYSHEVAGGTR